MLVPLRLLPEPSPAGDPPEHINVSNEKPERFSTGCSSLRASAFYVKVYSARSFWGI